MLVVRANKHWSSLLCHSLVRHTNVDLFPRYSLEGRVFSNSPSLRCQYFIAPLQGCVVFYFLPGGVAPDYGITPFQGFKINLSITVILFDSFYLKFVNKLSKTIK